MPTALDLAQLVVQPGEPIGVSDWVEVSQAMIDAFAATTGDTQWIHTDCVRAAGSSFGAPIAHGFLTLSLISRMMSGAVPVAGATMVVNYGLNKVRFIDPVPAGSRIRARFAVADLQSLDRGMQVTWQVTVEREGASRPCCAVEWLVRYYR
jgi:acyl dehydratase